MAESQQLQNTLAAILANMQQMSEEIKSSKDENKANMQKISEVALKQNKSLQSLHDENKKIYTAVHEQAKQNQQLLELTEKRIADKLELICSSSETALERNKSHSRECEAKIKLNYSLSKGSECDNAVDRYSPCLLYTSRCV